MLSENKASEGQIEQTPAPGINPSGGGGLENRGRSYTCVPVFSETLYHRGPHFLGEKSEPLESAVKCVISISARISNINIGAP